MMVSLMVLLLTFIGGFFTMYQAHSRFTQDDEKRMAALHLAEAGIDHIIWRLRHDPMWQELSDEQDVDLPGGQYHLLELAKGPSGIKGIRMQGCVPNRTDSRAVCVEIYAEVAPVYAINVAGAFVGDEWVRFNHTITVDSYNSENGPYALGPKFEDGDITTNNKMEKSIEFNDYHDVKGHVYYPTGGTALTVRINVPGTITGGIGTNPADTRFQPVKLPPLNGPNKPIRVKPVIDEIGLINFKTKRGGRILSPIPAGVYIIERDNSGMSLKLNDLSQLVFAGLDTTIVYLEGNMETRSLGVLNTLGKPANLRIYGMDTCTRIEFDGVSQFHGVIYAPKAEINLKKYDEFFGSIAGRTIYVNDNSSFHYDEHLRNVKGFISSYQLHSWTQIK